MRVKTCACVRVCFCVSTCVLVRPWVKTPGVCMWSSEVGRFLWAYLDTGALCATGFHARFSSPMEDLYIDWPTAKGAATLFFSVFFFFARRRLYQALFVVLEGCAR